MSDFWRAVGHRRYILFVNEIWFVALNTKAHLGLPKIKKELFLFVFVVSVRIGLFAFIITAIL